MKVLSKRQILMLHSMLIAQSGDMDESELLEWLKAHIE